MKRLLLIALITWGALPFAEEIKTRPMGEERIVHVATALDHLTVLEFSEPVTMAAAGSSAFQIERHDNKVFIKPLIPGTSTDLFVWTASRRFGYELEPAGEVKDMNFVVDAPAPLPAPATNSREQLDAIADTLLTSALLSAERIDHTNIKDFRGRVIVRIEHVFTSNTSCYIHKVYL